MGEKINFNDFKKEGGSDNNKRNTQENEGGKVIKLNRTEETKKTQDDGDKWWREDKNLPKLFFEFSKLLTSEVPKKIRNLKATPEALEQSRQIVKGYTTPELMGWIENSNEMDWQAKPSFFNAVLEELKVRAYDKNQWLEG